MPHNTLGPILSATSPLIASIASFAGTMGLATNALPVPEGVPAWVPYLVSILGPAITFLGVRVINAVVAKKRALAANKERRAAELKADADPQNDAEAGRLQDEAAVLRAEVSALEAARN